MTEKRGRPPSNNPKSNPLHVRLDSEHLDILDRYCQQEKVKRTEAIRRGIEKLKPEIKE